MNHANIAVPAIAVPAAVRAYVSTTLQRLREHHRVLSAVAECHGRSNGYHLSLEVGQRLLSLNGDRARLASFHRQAQQLGVDGCAVVTALGGEPDFAPFNVPPYDCNVVAASN